MISHPWLQPDAPDPRGDNLRLIAFAVEAFLDSVYNQGLTFGIFIDYMSMHPEASGCEKGPRSSTLRSCSFQSFRMVLPPAHNPFQSDQHAG
eukprot:2136941-Prymnesium_polylepis.1